MIENLSAKELSDLIQSGLSKRTAIVDVRSPEEYAKEHIKGAINIPYQLMSFRYDELEPYDTLILYCAVGARAEIACKEIEPWDTKKLFCVRSDPTEWHHSHLPLEKL